MLLEEHTEPHNMCLKAGKKTRLLHLFYCFITVQHCTCSLWNLRPAPWTWTQAKTQSFPLAFTHRKMFIPSTRTNPQPKTKKKLKKRHHYSHLKRAFCWLLLFIYAVLLAPSHHCGSEPVCLFTDGRAQNNPHPHPHTLVSCIPFCFFSHTFSTPTLITAPVYRPQYSHTCECMCLPYVFHYRKEAASYSRCSCYRCRMRQILKTYQIHRCDRLVRFPN